MDLRTFDIFKLFSEALETEDIKYHNRDISWLAFNHRVLQEAKDPRNPLFERLKFIAIYSSNSDEFFRVRVASIRTLMRIRKKTKKKYDLDPEELLDEISRIVKKQQEEYGDVFQRLLLKEMRDRKIFLISEKELKTAHEQHLSILFKESVLPHIKVEYLSRDGTPVFLQNKQLYLVVQLREKDSLAAKQEIAIVELPTQAVPRFIELPKFEEKFYVIFLDDVIRHHLTFIFPNYQVVNAYSIKLTRDAELYFEDEFNGDVVEVLKKALKTRKTGAPSRLLYDPAIPPDLQNTLRKALQLSEKEMIPGGRYHNFSDFFTFPNPGNRLATNTPLPPVRNRRLDQYPSLFTAMLEQDWMLHFPYHSFDHVIQLLEEAAADPKVSQIRITLYRVASQSRVVNALITAARNKKKVTAYVELMARFDEESNIYWAEELKNAGAKVLYGIPELKVHSKLLLITRTEGSVKRRYAYLSTGNFNEKTATLYTDHGLFTSDVRLTNEMLEVFRFLNRKSKTVKTHHLLVAPFSLRQRLKELIDNEIWYAKEGKPASVFLKTNSLEDREMIDKLYEASQAGVRVTLIIRGICCLVAGQKTFSKNITAASIVGRFLEHGRIYQFNNGGNDIIYISSADWMRRNLSRRIEVAFPVLDERLRKEIKDIIQIQLMDSVKARTIDKSLKNSYIKSSDNKPVESQTEIYHYVAVKNSAQPE